MASGKKNIHQVAQPGSCISCKCGLLQIPPSCTHRSTCRLAPQKHGCIVNTKNHQASQNERDFDRHRTQHLAVAPGSENNANKLRNCLAGENSPTFALKSSTSSETHNTL